SSFSQRRLESSTPGSPGSTIHRNSTNHLVDKSDESAAGTTLSPRKKNTPALFWEHPPALDPEVVGRMMQLIRDHIRGRGRATSNHITSL
ncbi:hypothetical protein PHJA_001058000, partial [Phtheirospermum japonicum]